MEGEVRGARTGRTWRYQPGRPLLAAGSGQRYFGVATDDASSACLHRSVRDVCWQDALRRSQRAVVIASMAPVAAAPSIRRILDCRDVPSVPGPFGSQGCFWAVWEWADKTLHELLQDPDEDVVQVLTAVEVSIGSALAVLHAHGIVHMDVAPNNILRVQGVWKLADLDSCVREGRPAKRRPVDETFVHPKLRDAVVPAHAEFDLFGLERVLDALRRAA